MRSLRSRLLVLWALSLAACLGAGVLLVRLQGQSTTAQVQRGEAVVARACDLIQSRYAFYARGWHGPVPPLDDAGLRADLAAVAAVALAREEGVEGGIWQADAGALAYAYPTYPGTTPKTDLPAAEIGRIRAVNAQALRDEQPAARTWDSRTQALLLHACPLGGPIAGLTAWAMARVQTANGPDELRLGLGVLLALVVGMSAWLLWIARSWSRQAGGIEAALARHGADAMPTLPRTGERDLDRIVDALNQAGRRLAEARRRSEDLAARVAGAERLAALGRVAAGVAHEIRNPLAAIRLKAENALAGDDARRAQALASVLEQVARLDRLLGELLAMTQRRDPAPLRVELGELLAACAERHSEQAAAAGVELRAEGAGPAWLDPLLVGRALDNLVSNAVRHAQHGGWVAVSARREAGAGVQLAVEDSGPGVAPELRDTLFEPFVTGRADGTGLGLAIARELVEAAGGRLRLAHPGGDGRGARFVIELREGEAWPPS